MISKLLVMMLSVFTITTGAFGAEKWHQVAYDNCGVDGQQPHVLTKLGNYTYSEKEVSYKLVSKDSNARSNIFGGDKLVLSYGGLKDGASYKLKCDFLADDSSRVQQLVVNDQVLVKRFKLPKGVVVTKEIEISKNLYSNGKLKVTIKSLGGVNVVLSEATLFSTVATLDPVLKIDYSVTVGGIIHGSVVDTNSNKMLDGVTLTSGKSKVTTDKECKFSFAIPNSAKEVKLMATKDKFTASVLVAEEELATYRVPRLSPRPAMDKRISLNGTWKFNEKVPTAFPENLATLDKDIQVPGEWVMQGFEVEKNTPAAYARSFKVPAAMKDQRVKLRFDGVYSDTTVYVNGQKAGGHIGGFTPFELDVTDLVKVGQENELALTVQNESLADTMASGSQYACHQLGGISRKVTLFALPKINISSLRVETDFDAKFVDSVLTLELQLVNEGAKAGDAGVKIELIGPNGKQVHLNKPRFTLNDLAAGEQVDKKLVFNIKKPMKWDNENPNLYVIRITLESGEVFTQKIGFKKIEVRGDQVFLNGKPMKFRGCNRHEAHPLRGRSLETGLWTEDVKLFRDSNINLIRTCHYPPAEELMMAADEEGIFVEVEGPYCWEWKSGNPKHLKVTVQQNMEMVISNRNHPSVLIWSIANESAWGKNFEVASDAMRTLDPTRPQTFNWMSQHRIETACEEHCELANIHYPGYSGPPKTVKYAKRPVYFGEYIHLNAYNRLELASDRGLRDKWGYYLSKIWEEMYQGQGCLGGSIWSGIDDTFFLKDDITVGYGTWGPIDGWRRKKPEWFHVKKVYSPIRILNQADLKAEAGKIKVEVENRQDFSNLNHLDIVWAYGEASGTIKADVAIKSKGAFTIPCAIAKNDGSKLSLKFMDPRGFEVDSYLLPVGKVKESVMVSDMMYRVTSSQTKRVITLQSHGVTYSIDKKSGLFTSLENKQGKVEFSGPSLMILKLNSTGSTQMTGKTLTPQPFTSPCTEWKMTAVKLENDVVTVTGSYKEAKGAYTYSFSSDGTLDITYDFVGKVQINPRQVGVVFDIPAEFKNLSWKRKGQWSTYPEWHIGRLEGKVSSTEGFESTSVGPKTKPSHEWRLDRGPAGSHDFSSTKHNIFNASLTNDSGFGFGVISNGDQHTRAWIYKDALRLLVASFSNGGSERFLRRLSGIDDRHIRVGTKIKSTFKLNLVK